MRDSFLIPSQSPLVTAFQKLLYLFMKVFLPNWQSISSNPILTSLLMEFGLPPSFFILLLKTDIDSLKVFPFPKVLYKLFCIKFFSHNKSFYQLLVISPVSGLHFTTTFGSSSCFGYKRKKGSHNELPFLTGKAERGGFEPPIPFRGIHAFQACLLSHSSIFPSIGYPQYGC